MIADVASCLVLFMSADPCALTLAAASAGNSIAARMAIMAMTTRSSINVNADSCRSTNLPFAAGLFVFVQWRIPLIATSYPFAGFNPHNKFESRQYLVNGSWSPIEQGPWHAEIIQHADSEWVSRVI